MASVAPGAENAAPRSESVALGLGSNLGNRLLNLRNAVRLLKESGLEIIRTGDVFETEPWGVTDQPYFLNACLVAKRTLPPRALLKLAKEIEVGMGRTATRRWGERVIDIDILLADSLILDEPDLRIPHPRMHERAFVLVPLAKILPGFVHPETGRTLASMAKDFPEGVRICAL